MTAQPEDEAAPLIAAVPDPPIIRISSDPDAGGLRAFELAYVGADGEEHVETLHYRVKPPFAIYRRWVELDAATSSKVPARANEAARRFFLVGMPGADASRLLTLIEGDADEVGFVTADAISDIIELLRANAYDGPPAPVPPSPGSSTGRRSTGRSSPARKSSPASKSTASRRTKR